MNRMRMACFLLGCLLAGPILSAAQDGAKTSDGTGVSLVLELSDGSRIIGVPAIKEFKLATDFANIDIPLTLLSAVRLSGSGSPVRADLKNGDSVSGQMAATEIALETVFGHVAIPISEIRHIQVSGGARGNETFPDGLVLNYAFNVDEGERVDDTTGNANNGKVQGATYISQGKPAGAMSFNGDRQLVIVGNPACLQLQDFSIMAWVKRGDMTRVAGGDGGDAGIFGYGMGGYILAVHPDGHLLLSKTGFDAVYSDCQIHDADFHQIGVTKQGNQIVFYLDGAAFPASDYNPGFEFRTDAAVGARADNFIGCFIGAIGELEVFNRALSSDEVKGIYAAQK